MAVFGIQDYQPRWLHGLDSISAIHGRRLNSLVGLTLRHVWLVWDLVDDSWFADAPVLLDFGREQVELAHYKFDGLSLTWSTIDPSQAIANLEDSSFHLVWRAEPLHELASLPGGVLNHIELLEWSVDGHDMANGSVAVGFDLAPAWLTVFNALDENGLGHEPPGPTYRRHVLGREGDRRLPRVDRTRHAGTSRRDLLDGVDRRPNDEVGLPAGHQLSTPPNSSPGRVVRSTWSDNAASAAAIHRRS